MTIIASIETEQEFYNQLIQLGLQCYPTIAQVLGDSKEWYRFSDDRRNGNNHNLGIKCKISDDQKVIHCNFYNNANASEKFTITIKNDENNKTFQPNKKVRNDEDKIRLVDRIIQNSKPLAKSSTYLSSKGIDYKHYKDIGLLANSYKGANKIVIPFRNNDGVTQAVELINENLKEKTKHGDFSGGCNFSFGNSDSYRVFIVEGLSTALTIYMYHPEDLFIVTGGIQRIEGVVEHVKRSTKILVGDCDLNESSQRKKDIDKLALKLKIPLILPYEGNVKGDFNDLYNNNVEACESRLNEELKRIKSIKVYATLNRIKKMNIPERKTIIDPILPEGGLIMIHAARGVGKTYLSIYIATCLAKGKNPFPNYWTVTQPKNTLYVDGEMNLCDVKPRFESFGNTDNSDENLIIISPQIGDEKTRNLSLEADQQIIQEAVDMADVIIFDSLSTLFGGGAENESSSWDKPQEYLLKLKRQNKTVILIHHDGKQHGIQRGSSKKEDMMDTIISLQKTEDSTAENGIDLIVTYTKNRGFTGSQARPFRIQMRQHEDKVNVWYAQNAPIEVDIEHLSQFKGMSQKDIAKAIDTSPSKVCRILKSIITNQKKQNPAKEKSE